ncbi:MAG: DUF4435 domain-containing protein [Gemmatimonadetes bacterium]|nr:DUF4435 domain-containing protein [Gemmatimonadota bacterium]MYB71020.1 DUF4435 domain-containing protein [Gemmatimonadota bacterium]
MDQTGDTIANTVLLIRDKYNGPVLLLEGDNDVKFFRRFAKDSEMPIIPAWGKENVLDAVEILESDGSVQGFLGIVDADFGHVDDSLPASRNVVVTDDHDVEMMIIKTKAFSAVLRELGSKDKVSKFPTEHRIRYELMQKALIIGHLRHLSLTDDFNLRFEGLSFEKFIDRDSLEIDIDEMIRRIFELKRIPNLGAEDIRDRLLELVEDAEDDPYQICCGHDFVAIFGIALRKVLGNQSKEAASPAKLGIALRLAYDSSDFLQTKLYSDAKQWSKGNQGYDIFI